MSAIQLDHVAIAVPRMVEAPAVLVGVLGGAPTGAGGPSGAYTWAQWGFAGGGRLELRIVVDVNPDADEGPLAIDYTATRIVSWPGAEPVALGTRFQGVHDG